MAYRDFKSEIKTAKQLGLTLEVVESLFTQIKPEEPSTVLKETLELGLYFSPASEKARNELLVMPIFLELIKHHAQEYSVVSGAELNVDAEKGLKGFVDFIICHSPRVYYLQSPLVAIVEAKKADIELGVGQAIAEMMGIKIFNQKEGVELETIYGCVTTGSLWRFLCLKEQVVYLDKRQYSLDTLSLLLGVWKQILKP